MYKKKVAGVAGRLVVVISGVGVLIIGGLGVCGVVVVVVNSIGRELVCSMVLVWEVLQNIKIVLLVGDFLIRVFRILCLVGCLGGGGGESSGAVLSPD